MAVPFRVFLGLLLALLGALLALFLAGARLSLRAETRERLQTALAAAALTLAAVVAVLGWTGSTQAPLAAQAPAPPIPAAAGLPQEQRALAVALEKVAVASRPGDSEVPAAAPPAPSATAAAVAAGADPAVRALLADSLATLRKAKEGGPGSPEAEALKDLLNAGGLDASALELGPQALEGAAGGLGAGDMTDLLQELGRAYQAYRSGGGREEDRQRMLEVLRAAYRDGRLDRSPQVKAMVGRLLSSDAGAAR